MSLTKQARHVFEGLCRVQYGELCLLDSPHRTDFEADPSMTQEGRGRLPHLFIDTPRNCLVNYASYVRNRWKHGSLKETDLLGIRYSYPPVYMNITDLHVAGVTPSSTVWFRSKAKISRLLRDNAFLETRTPRKPSTPLPHEVVEMIIAHLICDLRALKACSLTCLSWYIAAVPHLHHTITFREKIIFITQTRLRPLSKLHGLGIIPLVREVRVLCSLDERPWFKSRAFSRQDLRYFSAFANVQKLRLEKVDISSFIPKVGRYFGQFSATLRSITLIAPCCYTPRELSYFLSLFSNLDDIEIRYLFSPSLLPNPPIPDTELVPISAPKLRGQLVAGWFCEVETWSALITWCGGLRFHSMTLYEVADCAPLLLDACSETLETLRFFAEGSSCTWFQHEFTHGVELMISRAFFPAITPQHRSITTQGSSISAG